MIKKNLILIFLLTSIQTLCMESIKDVFPEIDATDTEKKFCVICQKNIKSHQTERSFPCKHALHNKCYRLAIMNSEKDNTDFNCPSCRSPIITRIQFPSVIQFAELWHNTKNNPDRLTVLRNEAIKNRCISFSNFLKRHNLKSEEIEQFIGPLFVESIGSLIALPRLQTLLSERNFLDRQLTLALEKLNFYENQNIKEAPIISQLATVKSKLEKAQQKLEVKKQKLNQLSITTKQALSQLEQSIVTKFFLRLGLTTCTSIISGYISHLLLINSSRPKTSATLIALAVAYFGIKLTSNCFMTEVSSFYKLIKEFKDQ